MRVASYSWVLLSLALACNTAEDTETARASGDTTPADTTPGVTTGMNAAPTSGDPKIDDALSAGPASITKNAAIMTWPDSAGGEPRELRAGSNGWTCFASTPTAAEAVGKDPMCVDQNFLALIQAWGARTTPKISGVGLGYMFQGDVGVSNTDPFATAETADNQWVRSGPHIMMYVPNPAHLEGISADPANGGPWVMWKGTPYAHVMIPTR